MVNGLHTSALGMMHLQKKQDLSANNLANGNSAGFKASRLLTSTEVRIDRNDEQKLHQDEGQYMDEVYVDFSQGSLLQTDQKLDLAIHGEGFFMVETPEGQRYTRNGAFTVNSDGELVTLNGNRVLADNGDYILIDREPVVVQGDGNVFLDGRSTGKIGVWTFPDRSRLIPEGAGNFNNIDPVANRPGEDTRNEIRQGFLEGSNIDTVDSMVRMIAEYRNYEANQKVIHAIDDTLGKAVNEIGRLG